MFPIIPGSRLSYQQSRRRKRRFLFSDKYPLYPQDMRTIYGIMSAVEDYKVVDLKRLPCAFEPGGKFGPQAGLMLAVSQQLQFFFSFLKLRFQPSNSVASGL